MDFKALCSPTDGGALSQRRIVTFLALTLQSRETKLKTWLWFDVRNNIIDVGTRTIALGLYTSVALILIYIVISRKWRDGVTALILFAVLPHCITQFGVWLTALSRLAQLYSLMHANILDVGGLAGIISSCLNDNGPCGDAPVSAMNNESEYTAFRCVGTALLAADRVLHAAAICGATAVFLLSGKRLTVVTGSLLSAPILAACVSAAMHVKSVCHLSEPITMTTSWEVYNPEEIDSTTARLLQLTPAVSALLVAHQYLVNREALKQFLGVGDVPKGRRLIYWIAITFVLPSCVNMGWMALRSAYYEGPQTSVLQYTFFSAGDALLKPLTAIYPALCQLAEKIRDESRTKNDSKVISAQEKSDAPAFADDAKKKESIVEKQVDDAPPGE